MITIWIPMRFGRCVLFGCAVLATDASLPVRTQMTHLILDQPDQEPFRRGLRFLTERRSGSPAGRPETLNPDGEERSSPSGFVPLGGGHGPLPDCAASPHSQVACQLRPEVRVQVMQRACEAPGT
jgi:hypothetical protein